MSSTFSSLLLIDNDIAYQRSKPCQNVNVYVLTARTNVVAAQPTHLVATTASVASNLCLRRPWRMFSGFQPRHGLRSSYQFVPVIRPFSSSPICEQEDPTFAESLLVADRERSERVDSVNRL